MDRLLLRVCASPKLVVAPMVHHSDLAYRLQTRRYGAQLVYTEMLAVASFLRSARHRRHMFQTCPEDRPLIVQVCQPRLACCLCVLTGPQRVCIAAYGSSICSYPLGGCSVVGVGLGG